MTLDERTKSAAARALLAFYREAGVDALVGETPVDRFAGDPPKDLPVPTSAVPQPSVETRVEADAGAAQPRRTVLASDLAVRGRATGRPRLPPTRQ